jgi:hypothetical protein
METRTEGEETLLRLWRKRDQLASVLGFGIGMFGLGYGVAQLMGL